MLEISAFRYFLIIDNFDSAILTDSQKSIPAKCKRFRECIRKFLDKDLNIDRILQVSFTLGFPCSDQSILEN